MDLSIIIVNYKTKEITSNCLKTIQESKDSLKKEIIVVDNGSDDGSLNYLSHKFPQVHFIDAQNNLGFAKGNNLGISKAKGKYVWLLNSDTLLKPDTISTLMKLAVKNNSQIASCRLLNPNGSIQPQGGFKPNICRLAAWMLLFDDLPFIKPRFKSYQQSNPSFFTTNQHPDWLSGTALLIKTSLYRQLNGLDENIFMYGEDVDFCYRAGKQGIKLDYFSQPSLTHLGQASGSSQSAILGEYKGITYLYKKHFSFYHQLGLKILLKLGALLRILIFGIILKDEPRKTIYEKAFRLA